MTLAAVALDDAPADDVRSLTGSRCQPQRLLVVTEHELLRAGLRAVFVGESWVDSCLVANSAETAWQVARSHHPGLVLVSTSLRGKSGIELCRRFKEHMPYVRVVLLSTEGRVPAASALAHGAMAALSVHMPAAAMVAAVKRVAEGARVFARDTVPPAVHLSKRELDVLQHLSSVFSNPEVAEFLNLSRHTVKQHTSAV